jgi:hypothetical protein
VGRHGKLMRGRTPVAQQRNEWAATSHAKCGALRPYVTAGIALVGASVIAVSPVTPALPGLPVEQLAIVEQPATRLLASVANIPANLLIMMANIPYYESLALQEYAYALGPGGEVGGVPGWVPLSATKENGGLVPGPESGTGDDLYAVGGTGSWWKESYDGNTWGWDNGNWPQMAAMAHAILPTAFALPIVQQLEVFAEAEYIAGANVNCEFNCADVLGYLGRWLMFSTPLTDLLAGTTAYPNTVNAYNPDDPKNPIQPFWADASTTPNAHLQPLGALQAIADYFMQDPSDNPVLLPDPGDVLENGALLGLDYLANYNPFVSGSFLYWGAPTLYSVPALLAGLVQNVTGIPNQFIETPQWQGEIDPNAPGGVASGGMYPGAENAGPLSLLTGVPLGIDHLVRGLLGYLDPTTYLRISLGNTLLRTFADGSLPGSDIARLLEGVGIPALLDGVGLGNPLQSDSLTTSFASPDVSSATTKSGPMLQLTQQQVDSTNSNPAPMLKDEGEDAPPPKGHKGPILNVLTNNGNSATGSNTAVVGTETGTGTETGRPTPIKDAVKQAGSQLETATDHVRGGLWDATDNVKNALGGDNDNDNDNDKGDSGGTS